MYSKSKISIIIPVYNRERLLPETLDSIVLQSFSNWECILVDDQSTDGSYDVMQLYHEKDARFNVFKRPLYLKKGANSCRNFGFLQASGDYVKWFDSDDIMLPNHLEIAVSTLVENKLDFVITESINFSHETGKILGKPFEFDRSKALITTFNFAKGKIGWITDDFLGTRQIVEKIKYNENIITDGDEYNFFVRMLNQPFKGKFISEIVTHRRIHNNTLTSMNGEGTLKFIHKIVNIKYQTAQDLVVYDNKELICWFLSGYMRYAFDVKLKKEDVLYKNEAFKLICKYFSIHKGFIFIIALFMARYFNIGYKVMKYARS